MFNDSIHEFQTCSYFLLTAPEDTHINLFQKKKTCPSVLFLSRITEFRWFVSTPWVGTYIQIKKTMISRTRQLFRLQWSWTKSLNSVRCWSYSNVLKETEKKTQEKATEETRQTKTEEKIDRLYNGLIKMNKVTTRYYGVVIPTLFFPIAQNVLSVLNLPMEMSLVMLGSPIIAEYVHCMLLNKAINKLVKPLNEKKNPSSNEKLVALIEFGKELSKLNYVSWRGIIGVYLTTVSVLYANPFHLPMLATTGLGHVFMMSGFPFFPVLITLFNHQSVYPGLVLSVHRLCDFIQTTHHTPDLNQMHSLDILSLDLQNTLNSTTTPTPP
ncbi:hypothetical protein RFI_14788 [Reticulomyxa filosa]|uniref:Uncharacterized protein n=1 Tax=Reticulomyxa filosa TaxID=46433 RepID=X6NAT0_RETFI|nr:hypothetical protein RFI_14788 [Reticulomyxa filosa]|eukprot:ETO22412.1 hypothetical protein RFI_14788 [Reticulomyxa filosa]